MPATKVDLKGLIALASKEYDDVSEGMAFVLETLGDDEEARLAAMELGIRSLIHQRRSQERAAPRRKRRAMNANATATKPRISAEVAAGVSADYSPSIFDMYHVGAKRLGECTAADLESQEHNHRKAAHGHNRRVQFLSRIREHINGQTGVVKDLIELETVESWHAELISGD